MTWITIKEAALIANRGQQTIYRWVTDGKLQSRKGQGGVTLVRGVDVLNVEKRQKRGRPAGTATRR